jgi:hypothetical protein
MMRPLLVVAALAAACDPYVGSCPTDTIPVKVTGSCGTALATLVQDEDCRVRVTDISAPLDIPTVGQAGPEHDPVRSGGWVLWDHDCDPRIASCVPPRVFRRCYARRVDWYIQLDCINGTGAPPCQAIITE